MNAIIHDNYLYKRIVNPQLGEFIAPMSLLMRAELVNFNESENNLNEVLTHNQNKLSVALTNREEHKLRNIDQNSVRFLSRTRKLTLFSHNNRWVAVNRWRCH